MHLTDYKSHPLYIYFLLTELPQDIVVHSFKKSEWLSLEVDLHISGRPVQFSPVAQLCPTLCNPVNRSTPGLPVHRQMLL